MARFYSIALATLLCTGCNFSAPDLTIEESRVVPSPKADTSITGAARFMRASAPATSSGGSPFAWDTPPGWREAPISSARYVNLVVGEAGQEAECYVSVLSGEGGGIEANVNRWRSQMDQPPLTTDEIGALPSLSFLSLEALYVAIPGTFKGMSGSQNQVDSTLLGAMLIAGGQSVFVKMVGPSVVVDAERAHFEEFVQSLRPAEQVHGPGDGHNHGEPPQTAEPAHTADDGHNHGETMTAAADPHAGLPNAADPHAGLPTASDPHAGLAQAPATAPATGGPKHTAPDHWKRAPDRAMRLMTYTVGDVAPAECVVSTFPGDVGGLAANVNRWRTQMSAAPMTGAQIAALPTITVLGKTATLMEATGSYNNSMTGTSGTDYTMLGVICPLESSTLFVKMTGPAALIATEKDNFLAFCASLEQ